MVVEKGSRGNFCCVTRTYTKWLAQRFELRVHFQWFTCPLFHLSLRSAPIRYYVNIPSSFQLLPSYCCSALRVISIRATKTQQIFSMVISLGYICRSGFWDALQNIPRQSTQCGWGHYWWPTVLIYQWFIDLTSNLLVDPATSISFPKSMKMPENIRLSSPLTLVGVGVRTVSFLGIRVYSVGFYADLNNSSLKASSIFL